MLLKYYDFVTNEELSGVFNTAVPELKSHIKLWKRDEIWEVCAKCYEYDDGPGVIVHIALRKLEDIMKAGYRPWR